MPRLGSERAWGLGIVGLIAVVLFGGWQANRIEVARRADARVRVLTGGDPDAGRIALMHRPCGGCHQIPGIPGASGKVGPSLQGIAGQTYIAGRLTNTPDNLVVWIVDPHAIDPKNAMPPTGVGVQEARNIAAYLYRVGG